MFNKYVISDFKRILFITTTQLVLLFLFLFFTLYNFNYKITLSGLFGGLTSILSFLIFFLMYYFVYNNNISSKIIIRKFYIAISSKILFLIIILIVFFKTGIYSPLCFFIFLFFTQLTFWLIYIYSLTEK